MGVQLENELTAELEYSRVLCTIRARYGRAKQTVELSVIEAVSAELEASPLREGKGFVNRSVEACTARPDDGVLAGVTETKIRAA